MCITEKWELDVRLNVNVGNRFLWHNMRERKKNEERVNISRHTKEKCSVGMIDVALNIKQFGA
jgi:hypothetical protein